MGPTEPRIDERNVGSFSAKNTEFLLLTITEDTNAKWTPRVWPTELQVLCQPLFFLDSIVRAQASTAMSCVAARR